MDNFRVNVGTREELKDLVLYASEDKNVVVVGTGKSTIEKTQLSMLLIM